MSAYAVQFRRGTTEEHAEFIGKLGELTVDTTTWSVRVHDGETPGGHLVGELDITSLKDQIIQEILESGLSSGGEPMASIGSIKTGYASPGNDYIIADGSLYDRSEFPVFAERLGTRFNIESGPFNVHAQTIGIELVAQPITAAATSGSTIVAVGPNGGYWRTADDGKNWRKGSTSTSENLADITFGNGVFVTVGAKGTILYSNDQGASWSAPILPVTNADLTVIAFLNNRFVAFGAGGVVVSSTNGASWTAGSIDAFAAQTVKAEAYAFGLYIAAGTGGVLATSPDLITWTTRTTGHTNPINALAVNAAGTAVVAAGGTGTTANVLSSADGQTWTSRTTTIAQARTCVIWSTSFNAFICGGNAGTTITSPDGTTWTTQAGAATAFTTSAIVQNFVDTGTSVIGVGSTGTIVQATALATWASRSTGRGVLVTVVRGATAGGAFAFGNQNTNTIPSISKTLDNGSTWYLQTGALTTQTRFPSHDGTLNICTAGLGGVYNNRDITNRPLLTMSGISNATTTSYLNGKFWAVGAAGGVTSSDNGRDWTTSFSIPTTAALSKINYGNGLYITIGAAGLAYSSTDGETWVPVAHGLGSVVLSNVLYANGIWVITATTNSNVAVSTDGVTWTLKTLGANILGGIVVGDAIHVWNSTTFYSMFSPDTVNWRTAAFGGSIADVAWGDGNFMAVGGASTSPLALISSDGVSWTPRPVTYNLELKSVAYVSGSFITMAGSVSCVYFQTSTQGRFWTQRTGAMPAMPVTNWAEIPNVGAFSYGQPNGSQTVNIVVPFPSADQFRAPLIPPSAAHEGNTYIKAR